MKLLQCRLSKLEAMRSILLRRLQFIFLILSVWAIPSLEAAQELPIYRAFGSVKNQTDAERNAAVSLYFGEVIVRVSGRRDAMSNPVIRAAIPKASSYLFSFSYTGNKVELIDGKPQTRVGIKLDFSPQAINQLLKTAQLPLWPAQRPKVLVWTVYRDTSMTELHKVPDEKVLNQLQSQSGLRGLKVQIPEWDLEDNVALSEHDIWQLNLEKIKTASARYKPDVILIARYQPVSMGILPPGMNAGDAGVIDTPVSETKTETKTASENTNNPDETISETTEPVSLGPWIMEWQVIDVAEQSWKNQAAEVDQLFAEFTHQLADHLSSQYSVNLGQQTAQTYYMQISNIRQFIAVKKSQAYLKTLAMIQKSELIKVNEHGLLLKLTVEGDARLLASTLLLGKRLLPEFAPAGSTLPTVLPDTTVTENVTPVDAEGALANPEVTALADNMSVQQGTRDDPLRYVWQEE